MVDLLLLSHNFLFSGKKSLIISSKYVLTLYLKINLNLKRI